MLSKECFKANPGKFRVIGIDTFDYTDWIEGDFDTIDEAIVKTNTIKGNFTNTYIFDDKGNKIFY